MTSSPAEGHQQDLPLLRAEGLSVSFVNRGTRTTVVSDVSFDVAAGECVAIVGESGSGKSITAKAILGLLRGTNADVSGRILFAGRDLLRLSGRALDRVRGAEIGAVFQEPMTSLNPSFTVGNQVAESARRHLGMGRRQAWDRAVEMLDRVGIANARERAKAYPHEFSGGMRQRVMLAAALVTKPRLLVADEPTTALDVTIQARVLNLTRQLCEEMGSAALFITHDLGVVADIADRVQVMYAGEMVESATVYDLFESPRHPYTAGLLSCSPGLNAERGHLPVIRGSVPQPGAWPDGCRFHPRCPHAVEIVCTEGPVAIEATATGSVRCRRHAELRLDGVPSEVPTWVLRTATGGH